MTDHSRKLSKILRYVIPFMIIVCLALVVFIVIIYPDKHVQLRKQNDIVESDINVSRIPINRLDQDSGAYPYDTVVDKSAFLSKHDSQVFINLVRSELEEVQKHIDLMLSDYYVVTEWFVPHRSRIRIHDFRNMTVEQLSTIKVAMYHIGAVDIVDLSSIADMDSYSPDTGALTYRFPYSQIAFTYYEPKKDSL